MTQTPQYRLAGQLRRRINTLAHQAGQRYGLQRRDELIRLLEAQGRAGMPLNELSECLDAIEREAAP